MKCRMPRTKKIQVTPETVTLSLTGSYDSSYGYVLVDGTKYTGVQTLTLEKGTEITVFCSSSNRTARARSYVRLNGTDVATGTSSAAAQYTYTLTSNTAIRMANGTYNSYAYYYGIIFPNQ